MASPPAARVSPLKYGIAQHCRSATVESIAALKAPGSLAIERSQHSIRHAIFDLLRCEAAAQYLLLSAL
jgi:hypothetical protein